MITNAYAAKKALFDRLKLLAVPAGSLEGIDVSYAWRGGLGSESIYGGGVRFTHEDAVAERGVLIAEVASVSVYVRVQTSPPVPVEETDARAAQIATQIAVDLQAQPQLVGQMSFLGIAQGQGDYELTDDATASSLALQVRIETDLTYGGA